MPSMPETPSVEPRLIFDTTVLSNFAVVKEVTLLKKLYAGRACTTLAVADEIRHGVNAGYT